MKIIILKLLACVMFVGILGCAQINTGTVSTVSCYQCSRTADGDQYCATKRSGGKSCKTESDQSGTSCIQQGVDCGIGHAFGGQISLFSAPLKDKDSTSLEERINAHFSDAVIPKMQESWEKIEGKGAILIMHSYTRLGNSWIPTQVETVRSSLSESQAEVALNIIRNSVDRTSLPATNQDSTGTDYVLYWEWPVPLPSTRK